MHCFLDTRDELVRSARRLHTQRHILPNTSVTCLYISVSREKSWKIKVFWDICYSHSCTKRNGRKAILLSCGLGYERRSKLNTALIAGMDPENPATEVKQFRPSKKRKKSASAVTHARKKAAQKARETFLSRRGLSSLGRPGKGKNLQACCGLGYERRSKTNRALIAGMDPQNPAT